MKIIDTKRLLIILALNTIFTFKSCKNSGSEFIEVSQQEEVEIVEKSTERENVLDEDFWVVEQILASYNSSFGDHLSTGKQCPTVTYNTQFTTSIQESVKI